MRLRLNLMGYITSQYCIILNPPSPSLFVKKKTNTNRHMVVGTYAFLYIAHPLTLKPQLVPFFPSLNSWINETTALQHRVGREMPSSKDITSFVQFARHYVIKHIVPIHQTAVPCFEQWLDETNYTSARKAELLMLRRSCVVLTDRERDKVKCFIKAEGFEKPKVPRAICSPSDHTKVLLGPLVSAVDKNLYRCCPQFIKGTDPSTWPRKLMTILGTSPVLETDFSSFEAHHREDFSRIVWFWIKHSTSRLSGYPIEKRLIRSMILNTNTLVFKNITAKLDQRLMSGSLWTSSANGLLNLLIMNYLTLRAAYPGLDGIDLVCHTGEFRGVVEGDDGICVSNGIIERDIERLGVVLEMEKHVSYITAGFCSVYCEPDGLRTVRDPLKVMRNFFLLPLALEKASRKTCMSLLRAKALSLKHLCPDGPVIGVLADVIIEMTLRYSLQRALPHLDMRQRELLEYAKDMKYPAAKPSIDGRNAVASMFRLPLDDQLRIETKLLNHDFNIDLSTYQTAIMAAHVEDFISYQGSEQSQRYFDASIDLPRGKPGSKGWDLSVANPIS